jgi:hypothetical protein
MSYEDDIPMSIATAAHAGTARRAALCFLS